VIHKTTGESILAEIHEIGVETVSYKEADFLDGPLRLLLVSELDSIVLQNGTVHRFENKPSTNNYEVTRVKTGPRTMTLDASVGVSFFVNNIYNKKIAPGPGGQLKFTQQFSANTSYFAKARVSQSSSAHEEASEYFSNSLNSILSFCISGGVEYNIIPYSTALESKKVKWHPYISIGLGFSMGMNNYFMDLQDANGCDYHYWEDGTIRNLPQSTANPQDVLILERDYTYETKAQQSYLISYAVAVPVEFGLRIRITNRFGLNLAFSTSTDVLVKDVSFFSDKKSRFNFQLIASGGLSIFID